jgi:hypothetical protein
MVDDFVRSTSASREAEDDERFIELDTGIFISYCTSSMSPEDDIARSPVHLDFHMSMTLTEKESISDRLLSDDPLLSELIYSLLHASSLHVV